MIADKRDIELERARTLLELMKRLTAICADHTELAAMPALDKALGSLIDEYTDEVTITLVTRERSTPIQTALHNIKSPTSKG
jgi:hypothetical protein